MAKRANQITERDGNTCQRCGDHNGNYDDFPLAMNAHHIVPGKHLSKSDARVDLNLVTLCGTCHANLEGVHVEQQLAEIGQHDGLRILEFLKGQQQSIHWISRELKLPENRVESLVDQLQSMNCVRNIRGQADRAICPAVSNSAAKKYEAKWKREKQAREQVENAQHELRCEFLRLLNDFEHALERGEPARVEAVLQHGRNVLENDGFHHKLGH